ncbi:MAG: NDP-sugar synthase [Myxococcota bacterium]|nr:NDP-sugar synthase [Myxococcota bacterium]
MDTLTDRIMTISGAILAAGLGTRMRPLTHSRPKPLVPIAGRPLIDYCIGHLTRLGIDTIGVNSYHLADQVSDYTSRLRPDIYVVEEADLQGTGGGIRELARHRPNSTLVVINGDALFDFDIGPALEKHYENGAMGTLLLRYVEPGAPFGRVGIDGTGRLHRIAEMDAPGADSLTLFYGAFTGVQIIEPSLIRMISDGPCDVLRTAYQAVLKQKGPIFGQFMRPDSQWIDVGNIDRYLDAHRQILDGHFFVSHLPCADSQGRRISEKARVDSSATIIGPCVIMPDAHIEAGASVGPYTFVDHGVKVLSGVELSNTVIWPNLSVAESTCNTVIYK